MYFWMVIPLNNPGPSFSHLSKRRQGSVDEIVYSVVLMLILCCFDIGCHCLKNFFAEKWLDVQSARNNNDLNISGYLFDGFVD